MKIIQGKYKGRVLKGFDIDGTRPTMDRVKESLFAMIQNKVPNSKCLDLFSGSGNLGIEALSMGANDVVFVDKNRISIKTINENLSNINENRRVLNNDYKDAILKLSTTDKFDIIFLDPPYKSNYVLNSIENIIEFNILENDGIIVVETDDKNKIEEIKKYNNLEVYDIRKYGIVLVIFIRKG